jgi:hypothetical protein
MGRCVAHTQADSCGHQRLTIILLVTEQGGAQEYSWLAEKVRRHSGWKVALRPAPELSRLSLAAGGAVPSLALPHFHKQRTPYYWNLVHDI